MEWVYMTDIKFIDVDDEQFEEAPKALRDAYKSLRKQTETLMTERDSAVRQYQARAIADVLSDKGFKNPKRVERDLLAEGIDVSDKEAIEGWLAENGDDYARGDGSSAATPDPAAQAQAHAHQQLAAVGGEARATGGQTPFERAQSKITPDMDGAQIAAVYAEFGV